MKTDTLFYDLVREFPQLFFQLIGKPEVNPNIYTFTAQEVNSYLAPNRVNPYKQDKEYQN